MSGAIEEIEGFVKPLMGFVIAHDYRHADRVRRWAIRIAQAERYPNLEEVEAAGLLHDIGLSKDAGRRHAEIGAELATEFLAQQGRFSADQIERIAYAIRYHSSLDGMSPLLQILQDADGMELFGALGLMRAISSKWEWADYEDGNVRGQTWGLTADDFTGRFRNGVGIGRHIVDQINFQISCGANLHTRAAREAARPLIEYMKAFVEQLEVEVALGSAGNRGPAAP